MTKISQLADLGDNLAAGDEFVIRDISDGSTPNKKVTASGFANAVANLGLLTLIAAGSGPQSRVQCTSSGTSEIIFTTSATERLRINNAGQVASSSLGSAAAPIFTFSGDTDTGLYSPGADQLAISTNGTERLRVAANGQIRVGSGSGLSPAYSFISDPNSGLVSVSAAVLGIATGGQTRTTFQGGTIDTKGGLLLGTYDSGDWPTLTFRGNRTGAGNILGKIDFANNGSVRTSIATSIDTATATDTNLVFSTSGSERLRIDSSGRLGLGTSSPNALLTVNGVGAFGAGSAAAPSIAATGDLNTGVYFPGADFVALSTAGTGRLFVDSSGKVGIGSVSPPDGGVPRFWVGHNSDCAVLVDTSGSSSRTELKFRNSNSNGEARITNVTGGPLTFYNTSTEAARIDSSARLLLGTSTARGNFSGVISPGFQIEGAGDALVPNRFLSITHGEANSAEPVIILGKHRSNSIGGLTVVQSGDQLGRVSYQGSDGTNFREAASISAAVDGTPGASDMPGRLVFSTTADGAASPTEAMRINNQRELLIGTTTRTANGGVLQVSNGITFPATAVACTDVNTLDDYEEGTWTPTIAGSTTPGTATYSIQNAKYTKVGRLVQFELYLQWASGTGTGNIQINGLPFTCGGGSTFPSVTIGLIENVALTANNYATAYVVQNNTTIAFRQSPTGGGAATDVPYDAAGEIMMSGTYAA